MTRSEMESVLIAAVILTVSASVSAGREASRVEAYRDEELEATKPAPVIEFDSMKFDFGPVGFGTKSVSHRFVVRNKGNETLHILEVKSECSCVLQEIGTKVLKPGEEGYIDVRLELASIALQGKTGVIERSLFVKSNDPATPLAELTLLGARQRNHFYYPSTVQLGPVYVKGSDVKRLYYLPRQELLVDYEPSVGTTADFIKAEIERRSFEIVPADLPGATGNDEFDFALSPSVYPRDGYVINVSLLSSAPAGIFSHYVVLETGDPIDSQLMIRVNADIREPLEISPRRLFLGLVEKDADLSRRIRIRSMQKEPFTVKSATSELSFISPAIKKVSEQEWEVELNPSQGKLQAGAFRGHLVLTTDYQTMEEFTIGVYGFAEPNTVEQSDPW